MSALYRVAWALARPLAAAAPGSAKLTRALRGRFAAAGRLDAWARDHRTGAPLVWFHAASVGEGRQAEAVLTRIRALRPDWQIAYTHASASAEALARSLPADVAGYLPADVPADVERSLDALKPAALVFAATDLWAVLVERAARRGVGLALVAGTLAPTSSRRGGLAARLLGPAYAALDRVGAIDTADADGLTALGVARDSIVVTGDTRHDAAAARAAAVDPSATHIRALAAPGPPIVVAGSTWPADEILLVAALRAMRPRLAVRVLIAPHEPTAKALGTLERRLVDALPGARVVRLHALETGPRGAAWDVCLVDRMGVLADLYAVAAVAYVGGGFGRRGLHSVIEPAAHGVPVVFGPNHASSRDATLLLRSGGGAVATNADLPDRLRAWLGSDAARAAAGAAARAVVERGLGAADRSADIVIELVEGRRA